MHPIFVWMLVFVVFFQGNCLLPSIVTLPLFISIISFDKTVHFCQWQHSHCCLKLLCVAVNSHTTVFCLSTFVWHNCSLTSIALLFVSIVLFVVLFNVLVCCLQYPCHCCLSLDFVSFIWSMLRYSHKVLKSRPINKQSLIICNQNSVLYEPGHGQIRIPRKKVKSGSLHHWIVHWVNYPMVFLMPLG